MSREQRHPVCTPYVAAHTPCLVSRWHHGDERRLGFSLPKL